MASRAKQGKAGQSGRMPDSIPAIMTAATPDPFDLIQPIVLVGGRSQRFGRDKLREPVGNSDAWLVDRPIAALRTVFGARVGLVGDCHPDVARRGDLIIPDWYPGAGPAGGILSALEETGGDVFVLAGDLPFITPVTVLGLLRAAQSAPAAWAVLAVADDTPTGEASRIEPCIGLYRHVVTDTLAARLEAGRRSLHDLLAATLVYRVPVPPRDVLNVNTPGAPL